MKYCSHCGKEILDEAAVCPYCGCLVKNEKKLAHEKHIQKNVFKLFKTKKAIALGGLIVLLLAVAFIVILNNNNIFDKVSYGMSMEEVHSTFGEPDDVDDLYDTEYNFYDNINFAGINGTLTMGYDNYGNVEYISWTVWISDDLDSDHDRKIKMIEKVKKKLNKVSGLGAPSYSDDDYYTWDTVTGRSYVLTIESYNFSIIAIDSELK
jgi:DNA-directed RNA polymerase subunit RPC12/RpoP